MAPVSASRLLKKGVYPLSRSAAATCVSCARVAIPVSWSMIAKPPSWGSMPVMGCSLSVQAGGPGAAGACPGGTGLAVRGRCAGSTRGAIGRRPPCPPGVSYPASASPLGPPVQPGHPGAPGPWGASPFPAGPTGGTGGPAPRGWTLVGPHRRAPGGRSGCLLITVCVVGRLGRGTQGVRAVP